MNKSAPGGTRGVAASPSPERTLRRLFLTLFLRGRSSRGLQKDSVPKSVSSKLGFTLLFYALFGLVETAPLVAAPGEALDKHVVFVPVASSSTCSESHSPSFARKARKRPSAEYSG